MGVETKKPLTKKELAAAMGWKSAAYLSKRKFKGMPKFYRVEDFKIWYESRRGKPSRSMSDSPMGGDILRENLPPTEINIHAFIRDGDFDELVIQDSEEAVQIAYGLLQLAYAEQDAGRITAGLRNWSEAAKQGKEIRAGYLSILKDRRVLVKLDEVFSLLGPVLSEIRNFLRRLGSRCCNEANPDDPALARRVIDQAVDRFLMAMDGTEKNLEHEIKGGE